MKMLLSFLALAAALPLLTSRAEDAAPAVPAPAVAIPEPVMEYKGRMVARTMHWSGAEWLLRANREQEENAALLQKELRIQPGWTIADIGCGNGYHSLIMAEKTGPEGKVLAVDIQPEMLAMLKARAEGRGVKNIQTIAGDTWDPHLPPGSCDLILLVDVYHEFDQPEPMMKAMHAALKPDGLVALVEYRSEDESVPIKPEHKMSKEQIRKEWLPMGFEVAREFDELPWQHVFFLRKAAVKPATEK